MATIEIRSCQPLKTLLRSAFPEYRKHHAIVRADRSRVDLVGAYWDGGSRSFYYRVSLETGTAYPLVGQAWNSPTAPVAMVEPGFVIVEMGTFCGKVATAVLTFHESDAGPYLVQEGK